MNFENDGNKSIQHNHVLRCSFPSERCFKQVAPSFVKYVKSGNKEETTETVVNSVVSFINVVLETVCLWKK